MCWVKRRNLYKPQPSQVHLHGFCYTFKIAHSRLKFTILAPTTRWHNDRTTKSYLYFDKQTNEKEKEIPFVF